MQVREIMSENPACCRPETPLPEVARLMVEHDCGEIPVLDDEGKPVGVITDRDITCRAVAKDQNPRDLTARDCMSNPVVTVTPDTDVDDCCKTLEENQIRRTPVVDDAGRCCGMVSQADVAQRGSKDEAAAVVREVSRRTDSPSRVGCC
jgi:CBS domain-containing protein